MNSSSGNAITTSSSEQAVTEKLDSSNLPSESGVLMAPADHSIQNQLQSLVSLADRIAVNQLTTFRNCLAHDLDEYRQHGVPGIGLSWRKLTRYGIRRSIRKIQQSRLNVSSLGWIGGFIGEHGYSLAEVVAEAKKVIRVAAQVRAGVVPVVTGPQSGHIRSHACRIVVDALKELSDFAGRYDVRLALQPMHPLFAKSWSFVHSVDDALQIMDRVQHPALQMAFGTYHLWEEGNLLDRVRELAPRIGLVSLADWGDIPQHENDRLLPGEGRLPLMEIMQTLESSGFSGWYELEVWSRDLWKLDHGDLMRKCVAVREQLSSQTATS